MKHEETVYRVKCIENLVRAIKAEQDKAHKTIKEHKAEINFSTEYREKQINTARGVFQQYVADHIDALYGHAAAIETAENELEAAAIDLNDSTFANALNIINGMGAALPIDQQCKIAEQFRGDYPAEKLIAELYEKHGLSHHVKLTDLGPMVRTLRGFFSGLMGNAEPPIFIYSGIEKTCNKMLEAVNSDYRVDLGVSELAFMAAVHAGAGLTMTGEWK